VYKNNTKIKNIKKYHSLLIVLNSAQQKYLVHSSTHVSHNFCPVINIEQIKLNYKIFKTYSIGI
jgi:hypothetical protein